MRWFNQILTWFILAALLLAFSPGPVLASPPAQDSPCDSASYVADLTYPDDSTVPAGQPFTKTWRLRNSGTCTWTANYKLVFVSGNRLGGPTEQALGRSVAPGETIDISVNLTAPSAPQTYYSYWRLKNEAGTQFGISQISSGVFWIKIIVTGAVAPTTTPTAVPTATSIAVPTVTPTAVPTNTPAGVPTNTPTTAPTATTAPPGTTPCDWVSYVSDVTIPDNTRLAPGAAFTKTWRFRNIGTCTWTTAYSLVFISGNQLGGAASTPLPHNVAPGETVDISIPLAAPLSEGTHYSYWRLQNAAGQQFGIGSNATGVFWIKIITDGNLSPTPTPSPTPIFTPSTYCDHAALVKDVTVPDLSVFTGNTPFKKIWRLRNIGTCTWTTEYSLFYDSGNQMSGPEQILLPRSVAPGETIDVAVDLIAPEYPQDYLGYWRLKNASGQIFGVGYRAISVFWVKIRVVNQIRESFPFHDLVCDATWVNGRGTPLACPGKYNTANGSVSWTWNPVLQNGQTRREQPSLITIPNNSGVITGTYPPYHVQTSDRFTTTLSCFADHPDCDVIFELNYLDANGGLHTFFGPYHHTMGMPILPLEIRMDSLAGQTVQFVLTVRSNGSNYDDFALWLYPTIWRD